MSAAVRVTRYRDGRSLLEATQDWLLGAEAENNLILGIAPALVATPIDPPYLATVHAGPAIAGCAIRTPPHKLVITRLPAETVSALVDDVAECYGTLPGVLGSEPTVAAFADAWTKRTGQPARQGKRQRIHELERLLPVPRRPTGRLRPARDTDLELVTRWVAAFSEEVLPSEPMNAAQVAADRISRGTLFLWEDPEPVSMAAWAGKTPHGVRVTLVYTPPACRGCGYASACVSDLTRLLLERGNRFCFLYTDLANPTSNRIYQRLGYRAVCDATDWNFADLTAREPAGRTRG